MINRRNMSIFKPIQEKQAKGKVKTIFNEIKKTRKIKKFRIFGDQLHTIQNF